MSAKFRRNRLVPKIYMKEGDCIRCDEYRRSRRHKVPLSKKMPKAYIHYNAFEPTFREPWFKTHLFNARPAKEAMGTKEELVLYEYTPTPGSSEFEGDISDWEG